MFIRYEHFARSHVFERIRLRAHRLRLTSLMTQALEEWTAWLHDDVTLCDRARTAARWH